MAHKRRRCERGEQRRSFSDRYLVNTSGRLDGREEKVDGDGTFVASAPSCVLSTSAVRFCFPARARNCQQRTIRRVFLRPSHPFSASTASFLSPCRQPRQIPAVYGRDAITDNVDGTMPRCNDKRRKVVRTDGLRPDPLLAPHPSTLCNLLISGTSFFPFPSVAIPAQTTSSSCPSSDPKRSSKGSLYLPPPVEAAGEGGRSGGAS